MTGPAAQRRSRKRIQETKGKREEGKRAGLGIPGERGLPLLFVSLFSFAFFLLRRLMIPDRPSA
jgi:hypothetical protein